MRDIVVKSSNRGAAHLGLILINVYSCQLLVLAKRRVAILAAKSLARCTLT